MCCFDSRLLEYRAKLGNRIEALLGGNRCNETELFDRH